MHKINVFQNELDLYEEFWYQHSKPANVTPNISTGYFTFSVYHNLPLKKTFKNIQAERGRLDSSLEDLQH